MFIFIWNSIPTITFYLVLIHTFSTVEIITMKNFSQAVCENIGYYVYFLKDPRNNNIFYVGKGKTTGYFNTFMVQ